MLVQSLDQEDSLGGGNGNPLWYSYLENPMNRGAMQATVYRVTNIRTRLKRLSTHTYTHTAIQPNYFSKMEERKK